MAPRMAAVVWSSPILLLSLFVYALLDVLVGGATILLKRALRRKRGKRAGALVQLRDRGFRTALPSIHQANLRSLPNRMDELLLLSRINKDFSKSAALCFTETWLSESIPDNGLHISGFQLFRSDRIAELTGKTRGGGLCFYINESWCSDVTTLKNMCSNLEALFINCKPFYSPQEFSSFILVNVYVPPDACVSAAMQQLAEQITDTKQHYPDSPLIILGDVNKANLSRELPKYRQHVKCPTRDSNILDHCYTIIKDAYHSDPRAALGLSDHCLVHLVPTYRQKLKAAKPVLRTVKRWTNEAEQDLQACFCLTDWSVFEAATINLDELTETDAYRCGDKILYNQARNRLTKEIRVAKKNYSEKLKKELLANDPTSVWTGLKNITMYKKPPPQSVENQQVADDLNVFYCRFEKPRLTPDSRSDLHFTHSPTPPATPLPPSPCNSPPSLPLQLPSLPPPATPLPPPATPLPLPLQLPSPCNSPPPLPPCNSPPSLAYLRDITGPLLDSFQFAYRANRSVDDAVNMALHYILQHLDGTGNYARILFVDFSSAFNTIMPDLLSDKLTQLSVPTSICQWITSFLTDRQQLVRLGKLTSRTTTTSTGAPQGCVLSPLLFSLYTNDCTSKDSSVKLLKFVDDYYSRRPHQGRRRVCLQTGG
ncbi:putative RNA-directed DNA polymerase from transposon BS [Labeo rohita]|uniref:RNA-directed DNA polymerase from transposon BS n=1 Tax=Labeo rohita TaxID=84645 RepID=A0ABQ8MJ54_LABRO|nr:putative RNA-directed DNA polymerase from transposon BS [Labeo rohita]